MNRPDLTQEERHMIDVICAAREIQEDEMMPLWTVHAYPARERSQTLGVRVEFRPGQVYMYEVAVSLVELREAREPLAALAYHLEDGLQKIEAARRTPRPESEYRRAAIALGSKACPHGIGHRAAARCSDCLADAFRRLEREGELP